MTIDARTDVVTRRILAQGTSPEEWAIEVAQPVEGVWTTTFYVGVQSFRLADGDDAESEEHCMFIGKMFLKALGAFLDIKLAPLEAAIATASTLQTIIREWVEPAPAVGLSGAFSEDLYNEDGSLVTVEQARERNPKAFK